MALSLDAINVYATLLVALSSLAAAVLALAQIRGQSKAIKKVDQAQRDIENKYKQTMDKADKELQKLSVELQVQITQKATEYQKTIERDMQVLIEGLTSSQNEFLKTLNASAVQDAKNTETRLYQILKSEISEMILKYVAKGTEEH